MVGVVESLQFEQGFGLSPELQGWVSVRQAPRPSTGLMVRTEGDPQDLVAVIRRTLAERNSSLALTSVMTMEERAASVTARHRVVSMLLGIFAGISLFLVAAGLYGTIAFNVAGRTRELGLRASLGANRGSLLALVLRQGLGITVLENRPEPGRGVVDHALPGGAAVRGRAGGSADARGHFRGTLPGRLRCCIPACQESDAPRPDDGAEGGMSPTLWSFPTREIHSQVINRAAGTTTGACSVNDHENDSQVLEKSSCRKRTFPELRKSGSSCTVGWNFRFD